MNAELESYAMKILKNENWINILEIAKNTNRLYVWNVFIDRIIRVCEREMSSEIVKGKKMAYAVRIENLAKRHAQFLYSKALIVDKYCREAKVWEKISPILLNPIYLMISAGDDDKATCFYVSNAFACYNFNIVRECVLRSESADIMRRFLEILHNPEDHFNKLPDFFKPKLVDNKTPAKPVISEEPDPWWVKNWDKAEERKSYDPSDGDG